MQSLNTHMLRLILNYKYRFSGPNFSVADYSAALLTEPGRSTPDSEAALATFSKRNLLQGECTAFLSHLFTQLIFLLF